MVSTGAYVLVLFAGTQPALLFDTSSMVDTASQVYWRVVVGVSSGASVGGSSGERVPVFWRAADFYDVNSFRHLCR